MPLLVPDLMPGMEMPLLVPDLVPGIVMSSLVPDLVSGIVMPVYMPSPGFVAAVVMPSLVLDPNP